jgi:hypothetical protein
MRRFVLLIVLVFIFPILTACSGNSSWRDDAPVGLIPPELNIRQTQGQAFAARHVQGPISVKFEIDVFNPSSESIELQRLALESMGMGAYTLQSSAKPFKENVAPGKTQTVEMWAPANANSTISGANGPVTVRIQANFRSEFGKFQKIYIKQVNAGESTPATPR